LTTNINRLALLEAGWEDREDGGDNRDDGGSEDYARRWALVHSVTVIAKGL
jgi:hypothetical protein